VTLVLLPLKYEIDNSVTVTVVLLGGSGALYAYGRDIGLQVRQKLTGKIQVYGISAHSLYTSAFLVVLFDEYSRNIFHYYTCTLSCILSRYARLHAPSASL